MEANRIIESSVVSTPVEQLEPLVLHSVPKAAVSIAGYNRPSAAASGDEDDLGRSLLPQWLRHSWCKVLQGFASLVIRIALYTTDVVSDLNLAVDYYKQGAWWYGGLTTAFVMIPAFAMTLWSRRKWLRLEWTRLTRRADHQRIDQLKLVARNCRSGWRIFHGICQCGDDNHRLNNCNCYVNFLAHFPPVPFHKSKSKEIQLLADKWHKCKLRIESNEHRTINLELKKRKLESNIAQRLQSFKPNPLSNGCSNFFAGSIMLTLFSLFYPIERYVDVFLLNWEYRKAQFKKKMRENKSKNARSAINKCLYLKTRRDKKDALAKFVSLCECLMESSPQVILQVYIVLTTNLITSSDEFKIEHTQIFAIFTSVLSVSTSLSAFQAIHSDGTSFWDNCILKLSNLIWICSRVVPLSLFASVFPWWSSIVCLLIHYITSFVILHIFTRHKLQDIIIPAFGYSIAFFKVHYPWKKNTLDNNYVDDGLRKSFIVYHSVCFIENIALVICVLVLNPQWSPFWLPLLGSQLVCYFVFFTFQFVFKWRKLQTRLGHFV